MRWWQQILAVATPLTAYFYGYRQGRQGARSDGCPTEEA